MKCIILTVVCFAVIVKSHRLGSGRPGRHFGTDMESELGSDIGTGNYNDASATAVATATAVANGAGTARANAEAVAGGSGPSKAEARAVANSRVGMAEPRGQTAASNYEREDSAGENQYNSGANGAEREGFQKVGQKNYHNREHHRSSVTKIEHSETSDEHDIGGSEAYYESGHKLGSFNKFGNGANRNENNFEKASQQMESTL